MVDFTDSSNLSRLGSLGLSSSKNMDLSNSYTEEDAAESIDSGCVPDDLSVETWDQVTSNLNSEYTFSLNLLQHIHKDKVEKSDVAKENVLSTSGAKGSNKVTFTNVSKSSSKVPFTMKSKKSSKIENNKINVVENNKPKVVPKESKMSDSNEKKAKVGNLSEQNSSAEILSTSGAKGSSKVTFTNGSKSSSKVPFTMKSKKSSKIENNKINVVENNKPKVVPKETKMSNSSCKKVKVENHSAQNSFEGKSTMSDSNEKKAKVGNQSEQNSSAESSNKAQLRTTLEKELCFLRKHKRRYSSTEFKTKEKKLLRKIKVLNGQMKKTMKHEKRDARSALACELGIVDSVQQANKIYNRCGKMVFSKFDFSNSEKDKWSEGKKFDLNSFLSKLLKEKEKMKRLESNKPKSAVKFYESFQWQRAMQKVEGGKVKDDLDKLKKSLSRKNKVKKKSKAKWEERENIVMKAKQERQQKRKQNISKRKEQKFLKKTKGKVAKDKGKGKGGRVPGF